MITSNIRDVLAEYLTQVARVRVKSIQKCPFGQAYVQFDRIRDRDKLIQGSPHVFEDISISFCKHNEGINWRRAHLDRECWILLVGPPLDNWSTEDITAMVSKFGRLIIWENDAENKGRILAKIRCSELRDNPKSVRFTEGEQPEAESWTFSVEVLSQTLLGAGPQDEDPIPDDGSDPHLCLYNIFNSCCIRSCYQCMGESRCGAFCATRRYCSKLEQCYR
jgi:hypothetical protein